MSAEADASTVDASTTAELHTWSKSQKQLAAKIGVGFVVGVVMAGIVGPIVLTVVIGLLQGYHR